MGIINLLDTEISNKIAAGEVVERPASVVKELVENSIDAGAKKIVVEIKNGGNTYIRVTDDGCGMEKDDAVVAFLRHATSKIKTEEDLNEIYTLGFRGEALSSIGAVAKVDLYTKRREDEVGIHSVCEGGEIISQEDAGTPDGTTFIVKNLFYNVPARMKFLKKDATEAGYISDLLTRFIFAHPEISFKLINNSKEVLSSSGDSNLLNSVYSVYGRDYHDSMINVFLESDFVTVSGLIGKGSASRPNRNYQSFFVNKRYIKSPLIIRAVEEAYKNQVMIGKFPTAILNIEINPSLIDINVHPTKLEVKFSNESQVYQAVYHACREALYRITDIPEIKTKKEDSPNFIKDKIVPNQQITIAQTTPVIEKPQPKEEVIPPKATPSDFVSEIPKAKVAAPKMFSQIFGEEKKEHPYAKVSEIKVPFEEPLPAVTPIPTDVAYKKPETVAEPEPKEETIEIKTVPDFKLIGQVFNTYIIIEIDDKMMMIDQHAAHERLNYEKLKADFDSKKVYSQSLIIPVVVDLSAKEMAIFSQNIDYLTDLGFDAEEYGENSVIIRSVPIDSSEEIEDLFIEILSQLEDNKLEILPKKKERLLYTIACKASIKANAKMSIDEQIVLIKKVLSLDGINTCPHGRPIIVSMSKYEIEKQFKRTL